MNQTCPTCGADVAQRDRHAAWHTELDRRLASLEDAHRPATCHEATQDRELARALARASGR